jgi:predicted HAD superfamily hydrolase
MSHMVVATVAELSARLEAIDAEVDLISFDIFDTLLERHVEPPDAIKAVAARTAADVFAALAGQHLAPKALLVARAEAEASLRGRARSLGFDFECSFSDIAKQVAHILAPGKEAALYEALVEGELAAERQALFPKDQIAELLRTLRARGKRIIATSDMYLDGPLIRKLFRNCGLDDLVDHIYVSADLKLGKHSGRLFRHVLEMEGVKPARMVHVGDHAHSEMAVPHGLGIQAFHLHDRSSLRRRQTARTLQWLGERNPYWRGEHLLGLTPPSTQTSFHYRYGYDNLGPIFCGFVLGVLEEMLRFETEKIFFLAREGDLFRALYSALAPELAHGTPIAGYLHVSRKSVFLPAAWRGLSRHHLNVVLSNPKQKGLFSVANALGITPGEFEEVASRFGLDTVAQPIRGWPHDRLERLLADSEFQEIVIRHALPARLLLRRYLEGQGFFGKQRVALVDIGWNGTIQNALQEAFGEDTDFPTITGLYLSFNGSLGYVFGADAVKGILYDCRTSPAQHNVFALFEELFENAARALHGSTVGYRETEDGVDPVLRDDDAPERRAERDFDVYTSTLRRGVLDFATVFVKALRLAGYCFEDIKSNILARAERCLVYPSWEESAHLLEIVHAEDLGSDNVMKFTEYRLPGPSILLRPRRFIRLLRTSNWKYGTARTLGVPGFNYFLRRIELAVARLKRKPSATALSPHALATERLLLGLVKSGNFPALNRARKFFLKKWSA